MKPIKVKNKAKAKVNFLIIKCNEYDEFKNKIILFILSIIINYEIIRISKFILQLIYDYIIF